MYINGRYEAKRTHVLPDTDRIVFIANLREMGLDIEKYFYEDGTVYVAHLNRKTGGIKYYETRDDLKIKIEELDNIIRDFACGVENKKLSKY